jgi:ribosome-binding ATPase YchF (GTP1/OBG family)
MKVATFELDITPGKYKYTCDYFTKLVKKFSSKKETPYAVEFIGADYIKADAVVFNSNKKLDFIFIDLEKIESRLSRTADAKEKEFLNRLEVVLEKETLLCDASFTEEEKALLKNVSPITYKPCLGKPEIGQMDILIKELLAKAGIILFFTAGEKETRAWELKNGSPIIEAAGKIHTDLARGFIKADVVNCSELDKFHNMAEARAKGLVKTVDKNYIVQDSDIIEIKFSV